MSEELFPYYKFTVKFMLIALSAAYIVARVFYYIFDLRVTWSGFDFGDLITFALWAFVAITANFHFVGKYWIRVKFLTTGTPLPPVDLRRSGIIVGG